MASNNASYRIVKIPKGGRGIRKIYIPDDEFKKNLRSLLPTLQEIASSLDLNNVSHAFVKGRNCATNAYPHIGFSYSLSLDIKDFFDSIRESHVKGVIPDDIVDLCFIDGAPRQGLPTSPVIANIAMRDVDRYIHKSLKKICGFFSYTRYADDLTISFNNKKTIKRLMLMVRESLATYGFTLNENKTRIQSARNGRRVVTGIGVSDHGLHPTRKTLKSLRAAAHQRNFSSAKGLLEWSLCKLPGEKMRVFPELYRRRVDGKMVVCNYCLEPGLEWLIQNGDKYILFDTKSDEVHVCSAFPGPVSKPAFKDNLRVLGFRSVEMKSVTWEEGFWGRGSRETLIILFRKNGVDVCIYDYARQFPSDSVPYSIGSEAIYRLPYGNDEVNVHAYLLRLAQQMKSGAKVDRNILKRLKQTKRAMRS